MKILIVAGARPNFVKVAPILRAILDFNRIRGSWTEAIVPVLVHTGQHYDHTMSGAFFADLGMPEPNVFLGAGSGSHAVQTAEIMKRFEPVMEREAPRALVVVGDVNSTLACALAAAKLPIKTRPLIAHVEAGLRSFDRSMPEEINRILTDQISDLLFTTEPSALRNLRSEGIPERRVYFVGNTMIDSLREVAALADQSPVLQRFKLRPRSYALLTLHRAANVDDEASFVEILDGLSDLVQSFPVLFPAHPRTQKQVSELALQNYFSFESDPIGLSDGARDRIRMVDPQGYVDFVCLMKNARLVITDSGGVQEETTALGIPCVTVRDSTERPVTIEIGTNVLAGTQRAAIRDAVRAQTTSPRRGAVPTLWDGRASARIVGILAEEMTKSASSTASAQWRVPYDGISLPRLQTVAD